MKKSSRKTIGGKEFGEKERREKFKHKKIHTYQPENIFMWGKKAFVTVSTGKKDDRKYLLFNNKIWCGVASINRAHLTHNDTRWSAR